MRVVLVANISSPSELGEPKLGASATELAEYLDESF